MDSIIVKYSQSPGVQPVPNQLLTGEPVMNTYDGRLFMKKSDINGDAIVSFVNFDDLPTATVLSASFSSTASFVTQLVQDVSIIGSLNISGSTTQVGNNTLLGNTLLSGSLTVSGSIPGTGTNINIYGDTSINGVIKLLPSVENIDATVSASYIYVSGSTNDLYFAQNGNGYANTTRLRWLEGNLYTGLLSGGLISITAGSTTFNISSGSGIIVTLNASVNQEPFPTIKYIKWGNKLAQSLTYISSSIQTFVGIDSDENVIQQTSPWNDGQYNTSISIGTVLHQNKSTVNASITYPNVAYGYKQRTYDFIKAFGPLKLSGFTLIPSGSLGLTIGSGTAFAEGRNYQVDPNNPSYITDVGTSVSKIFRYYQSGSEFVQDTSASLGYTQIDPANYNVNGTLTPVPGTGANREWSIKRVFWYPNSATKGIVVYYGNSTYPSATDAIAGLPYETFFETPNTQQNAIYVGAIAIRNNGSFTDSGSYAILPGGVFRNVGGSGGGGSLPTTRLSDLSDVDVIGAADHQPLAYDSTLLKWTNQSFISASISGTAATASYTVNAVSASYSATSSYADNFTVGNTLTAQRIVVQTVSSSIVYSSGSNRFGNDLTNTQTFTGSVGITGSLDIKGNQIITGSLNISGQANITSALTIGSSTYPGSSISISKNITGASSAGGVDQEGVVQKDVTVVAYGFYNSVSTQASSSTWTLPRYIHYFSGRGTIGTNSVITNQYGFYANSDLISATNNYGFYGDVPSATNRWNLYMNGTADNYLAGKLGIGKTTPSTPLDVNGNAIVTGSLNVTGGITGSLQGTATTASYVLQSVSASFATNATGSFIQGGNSFGALAVLGTNDNYDLSIETNGSEKVRINTSGNVGINTTTPLYGKLNINSSALGTNAVMSFSVQDGTYNPRVIINHVTSVSPNSHYLEFNSGYATQTGYANFVFGNGSIGVGTAALTEYSLRVTKIITGATTAYGIVQDGQVQSTVTNIAYGYFNSLNTQSTTFALGTYRHFYANQGTIGASSSISNQIGFHVAANVIGASANYGFFGSIPSGGSNWNLYMLGTANNYLAGSLGIGTTSVASNLKLAIGGNITGSVQGYGIDLQPTITSDVTTQYRGYRSSFSTQAATFTLPNLMHFAAYQSTIGSGSVVTSQYGFFVDSTLSGAGSNYAFYSSMTAAANRWNLYMSGTALNYLAGNLLIGTTSNNGIALQVAGEGNVTSTFTVGVLTGGNRTIALGIYGDIKIKASAGGWVTGTFFQGSAGTDLGGFGAFGGTDALNYLYIGDGHTSNGIRVYPTNNAVLMSGNVGIGVSYGSIISLSVNKNITGGISSFGVYQNGTVQSDVTTAAHGFYNQINTQAAAFTVSLYRHFYADNGTIGSGSTVNNQYGFLTSDLSGATTNYGFFGGLTAGANKWNLYMNGTANNYLAGSLGIGSTSLTEYSLRISENITGATTAYGVRQDGVVQSSVTSLAYGFANFINTQAATFTLNQYVHFIAGLSTIGSGSVVTNQYGFFAGSNLTSATNNFGFYGDIPSGSNRWNLYMAGTANNYLAGSLGIGSTVLFGTTLNVAKNITGTSNGIGITQQGTVQSDVTDAFGFQNLINTQATTFNLTQYAHIRLARGTIGAGSTITNQYGVFVESNLTNATNNYGYYGGMPSGSNNWNLYMAGNAPNYLNGSLGIGSTLLAGRRLVIGGNLTGATTSISISNSATIQSDVTSARYYQSSLFTQATTFTLTDAYHFVALQNTLGSGSSITNQFGVYVDSSLIGATNNFGFYGAIPSGSSRWNLYMGGTAKNYLAGSLGIGNANPVARLDLTFTPSISSTILKFSGTTTVNDNFTLSNATTNDNVFIPIFQYKATSYGYGGGTNLYTSGIYGGGFIANVDDVSYPNAIGAGAAMHFNSRNYDNTGALTSRYLFSWGSWLTTYMAMSSEGNLLLGTTTNNGARLQVDGNATIVGSLNVTGSLNTTEDATIRNAYIGLISAFGSNYTSFSHISRSGTNDYSLLSDNSGITYLNAKSGSDLKFRIDNIDKVVIDSNGNLGVNKISANAKLDVDGNSIITGSLVVTNGITSSLQGTASYALTASFANNFTVAGTLTAQTIVVQTISSSIAYSSGSNIFGNDIANTQTFTGSVGITGSLAVNGISTYTGIISGSFTANNPSSSFLLLSGSIIPASGSTSGASAIYTRTILSASANNQVLVGLDISPIFNTGSFTRVSSLASKFTGNVLMGQVPSSLAAYSYVPLTLSNNAMAALRTQLSLVNGGGSTGAGSAIDFFTYTDAGNGNPGLRIASVDDGNFSGNLQIFTKAQGSSGNGTLTNKFQIFGATGNTVLQNGGTFTDNSYRLQIQPAALGSIWASGSVLISGSVTSTIGFIGSLQGTATTASYAINATGSFIQGGNSFGSAATLGTNDTQNLILETNNTSRLFISSSGNVGVGLASIVPDNLSVGNSTTASFGITSNRQAGSIAAPKFLDLNFRGFNDSIMARIRSWDESSNTATGYLTFSVNKLISAGVWELTEAMRVNRYGNLLINATTDAGFRLDVSGSTRITDGLTVTGSLFQTGSTAAFMGSVGVGTSTPSNKLSVVTQGGADDILPALGVNGGKFSLLNNGGLYGLISGVLGTGTTYIQSQRVDGTATAYNLLLNPNGGNVGVGTTAPSYSLDVQTTTAQLQVRSTTGTNFSIVRINNTGGDMYVGRENSAGGNLATGTTAYAGVMNARGTYPLQFAVNDTIGLTILNGGNVGIGTTSPLNKLSVVGNQSITGSFVVTGSITIASGSITMPNRPAFRIVGTGGPVAAQTILSGSKVSVDFNQGNHFNTTTGLFTAPIAGLYQVNIVMRTDSNTNSTINQVIVYKSGSNTGGNLAQIMVEFGTNTSMNHAGGSTISKLEVGDTLKAIIAVGTCSFDGNDSFSAAYIG